MRVVTALTIFLLFIGCSTNTGQNIEKKLEQETILRVSVYSAESTDLFPENSCPQPDCIPFYFWFKYKAEVLSVVQGEFSGKTIKFAKFQHAHYIKQLTMDWHIVIDEFSNQDTIDKLGTKYYVRDHAFTKDGEKAIDALLHDT